MESVQPASPEPENRPLGAPLPRPRREKSSLRRRALLGAAGLAGVAALTRLARAGDLSPPAGPISPTGSSLGSVSGKIDAAVAQLEGKLDAIDGKVAFSSHGVAEPRTPIESLPSSADAQFVISAPGAYYLSSNPLQVQGKVCIDVQSDHVDIDGQGFVFRGGGGGGGGGAVSSCIRASGRQAIEIYDCAFQGWQGVCCDLEDCDDVYISDVLVHACFSPGDAATGTPGAAIRCRDRCGIEDVSISSCVGGAVVVGSSSYVFELVVADSTGQAVRCADGTCVEASHFLRVTGDLVVTGGRCAVCDCDFRQCDGQAVSTGSSCVVERCECVGGSGGGIRCSDGSCITDCLVAGRDAFAIECGSSSSVTGNRVLLCWGMACGSDSSCCDNELSTCSGGPDTPEGLGGAIVLRGARCTCEENWISSSRVGISVHAGASSCLVHSNCVTGAGVGSDPASGPAAGIVFESSATGCMCTCNHVYAAPGAASYLLGSSAHGPIVVVSSGDISSVFGSSHPLANTAV